MTIVKIAPCDNGAHQNQSKRGTFKNIPDGWAAVPDELESAVKAYLPWVNLEMTDGRITAVTEDTESKEAWEAHIASLGENGNGGEE